MKRKLLSMIEKLAYKYGVNGACMASFRGTYETEVPQQLRMLANKKAN